MAYNFGKVYAENKVVSAPLNFRRLDEFNSTDTILTTVNTGFSDISNSRSFDDVTNDEFLDRLILGDAASAIRASHRFDMASAVLTSTTIPSFAGLKEAEKQE